MPDYRLFCLDEAGRIYKCETFTAPDDDAAISHALELRGGEAAELWHRARRVKVFENDGR